MFGGKIYIQLRSGILLQKVICKVWEYCNIAAVLPILYMVLTCETSSCEKVMNKAVLYTLLIVQLQIVCHRVIVGYPEIPTMLKLPECDLEKGAEVQKSYDEAQHVQPMDLNGTWECLYIESSFYPNY